MHLIFPLINHLCLSPSAAVLAFFWIIFFFFFFPYVCQSSTFLKIAQKEGVWTLQRKSSALSPADVIPGYWNLIPPFLLHSQLLPSSLSLILWLQICFYSRHKAVQIMPMHFQVLCLCPYTGALSCILTLPRQHMTRTSQRHHVANVIVPHHSE